MIPALRWREIVRRAMPRAPGDDNGFLAYVEGLRPTAEPGLERYLLSVALLTYGRLDAADTVLDDLPPPGHPARVLSRAVDEMVAPGCDTPTDPAATRAWLTVHRAALRWNETEGRFV